MQTILVDTDVLVDHLRGLAKAVAFIQAERDRIALSAITVAELYAGVREGEERERLDELVSVFAVLPVTPEIARMAGLYKRDFAKSHGVGLADCLIASTAQAHRLGLVTLNRSHYPMLPALKTPYRKN